MMRALGLSLALALGSGPAAAEALAPHAKVAFLGLHFIDTSTEGAYFGAKPAELSRIGLLEDAVRDRFTAEGMELVDLAPARADIDRVVNPAKCYGCDVRIAQKLGADYVAVGEVQKVSNLILSMNLVVRAASDGHMARGRAVDIRSNTDESWMRGIRYILDTEIFKE